MTSNYISYIFYLNILLLLFPLEIYTQINIMLHTSLRFYSLFNFEVYMGLNFNKIMINYKQFKLKTPKPPMN